LLVAPDVEIERAAAGGRASLGRKLGADAPADWPPPLAEDVQGYWAERLEQDPALLGWTSWYWIESESRSLVGFGGFMGLPDPAGAVEVGYSVVLSRQRRGYATEAVDGLLRWAWGNAQVRRVLAHTFPELTPSIRVLEKLGFARDGDGQEPGTIRFALERR
jgi:RimJ/RimL family protein N-acetyltransferase